MTTQLVTSDDPDKTSVVDPIDAEPTLVSRGASIAMRGPSTSYDLKRAIGHSVGYFWHFPHAQLYSEPKRLEELGLLEVEPQEIAVIPRGVRFRADPAGAHDALLAHAIGAEDGYERDGAHRRGVVL